MSMDELAQYVRSVKESGHVCLIFENEDQKWDLEAEYVKRALEQGYQTVVNTMEENMQETREALIKRGIDVDKLTREGSLAIQIDSPEAFSPEEAKKFQQVFAVEEAKKIADEVLKNGKKGLYIASNTNTYFLRKGYLDQLFMAESLVQKQMENKLPFGYLCCYDVSGLTPSERPLAMKELLEHYRRISEQYPQLVHTHNIAIYASHEGGVLAQLPV
jgi:tRNA U34 5-methylaminomethyl-2-thiouridine-forming methyltransferase MnmC